MMTDARSTSSVVRFGLLLACLSLVYVCFASPSDQMAASKEDRKVLTPLGAIKVTYFGPRMAPTSFIAIHGMALAMNQEWFGVAEYLSKSLHVRVAVPDFHSNPATSPRAIGSEDFMRILKALLPPSGDVIMLGKSWGGAAVARFAASYPQLIRAVVLDAPALPASEIATTCTTWQSPLLLLWARDDPVVPQSRASVWQNRCPHASAHFVDVGGHTIITQVYKEPILNFVRSLV